MAEEYVDDDVSAWKGAHRPEYARLIEDLSAGSIEAVLVYDQDRLHRNPAELERFISLCEGLRVTNVSSVSGDLDLTTADGQFRARILGAVAKKESDDKSRRIRRKHEEIAEQGRYSGGGSRPYGYEPGGMHVRESEATVVRECVRRFLAGESIRALVADLNERGVGSASGGRWVSQTLRRVLGSGRIAGLREYKGEIAAPAEWEAIITREESERIRALLAEPNRRTNKSARRYLLAGLVRCGLCGSAMVARPRAGGQRRYACVTDTGGCGRMTVNADPLEALVVVGVLHRLDSPELAASLAGRHAEAPDAARIRLEVEQADAQLLELAGAYGQQKLSMAEMLAARTPIEARRDAARKQLARVTKTASFEEFVGKGDELRSRWDGFDLSRQHAIVEALTDRVVIAPGRRGYNQFDPERVSAVWRG